MEAFLLAKSARGLSPRTIADYRTVLYRLAGEFEWLPVQNHRPIVRFMATKVVGDPETREGYWRILRTFYNWLLRGKSTRNPMLMVDRPMVPPKVPKFLLADQLYELLTHPSHDWLDKTLLFFLSDSNARLGEAANLSWPDVMDDRAGALVRLGGKTSERIVPIHSSTRQMMEWLPREPGRPRSCVGWAEGPAGGIGA